MWNYFSWWTATLKEPRVTDNYHLWVQPKQSPTKGPQIKRKRKHACPALLHFYATPRSGRSPKQHSPFCSSFSSNVSCQGVHCCWALSCAAAAIWQRAQDCFRWAPLITSSNYTQPEQGQQSSHYFPLIPLQWFLPRYLIP